MLNPEWCLISVANFKVFVVKSFSWVIKREIDYLYNDAIKLKTSSIVNQLNFVCFGKLYDNAIYRSSTIKKYWTKQTKLVISILKNRKTAKVWLYSI